MTSSFTTRRSAGGFALLARERGAEKGSTLIELVGYVALLLLMLCFAIEAGVYVYAMTWADSQALSAVRGLSFDHAFQQESQDIDCPPLMKNATCSISCIVGTSREVTVDWHLPTDGAWGDMLFGAQYRQISATVSLSYEPFTVFGRALGSEGRVVVSRSYSGIADGSGE